MSPRRRDSGSEAPDWRLVEVPAAGGHRATVIWLHGLGADGHDFLPILPALGLARRGVRFVFPEAPPRPVTINGGMVMRAWYDIEALDRETGVNLEHLAASAAGVRALLDRESARGIPPERQVLAGFSQGAAVALETAVCRSPAGASPPRLAGVAALSGYLARPASVIPARQPAAPILQAHGLADEMIPFRLAAAARGLLTGAGWEVEFHAYQAGHEIPEVEVRDIGRFLRRVLVDEE